MTNKQVEPYVADLELCKELYELSGWDDTEKVYSLPLSKSDIKPTTRVVIDDRVHTEVPAYSLGYLQRKLQESLPYFTGTKYYEQLRGLLVSYTPENDLCQLLIAVHKEGLLK